jgi:hypothetical protein
MGETNSPLVAHDFDIVNIWNFNYSLYHCLNYGFMRNKESWNLERGEIS